MAADATKAELPPTATPAAPTVPSATSGDHDSTGLLAAKSESSQQQVSKPELLEALRDACHGDTYHNASEEFQSWWNKLVNHLEPDDDPLYELPRWTDPINQSPSKSSFMMTSPFLVWVMSWKCIQLSYKGQSYSFVNPYVADGPRWISIADSATSASLLMFMESSFFMSHSPSFSISLTLCFHIFSMMLKPLMSHSLDFSPESLILLPPYGT